MTLTLQKVLIMAGGTGGHVYPALSVAKILMNNGVQVTWLGTRRGIEARLVIEQDIAMQWVDISGLIGKGWKRWLVAPFTLTKAVYQSIKVIHQIKPDVVLGLGGFVSGPGGVAAWLTRTPLIIHEQNAVAGLTNRLLAKIATSTLRGFKSVEGFSRDSTWVGNPVRSEIEQLTERPALKSGKMKVLVLGGSQGASSLNRYLPRLFASLISDLDIWHQCGKGHQQAVQSRYQEYSNSVKVTEFIEKMAEAYAWADVVICRSGAMTLAECCASAKAMILVPYPYAAADHQMRNATVLVKAGAAKLLPDSQLEQLEKLDDLSEFIKHPEKIKTMNALAYSCYQKGAAQKIIQICEKVHNA